MNLCHRFFFLCSLPLSLLAQDIALLEELRTMCEKDQQARFAVINAGQLSSEEGWKIVEATDQENLPRLKAIVEQAGWPGFQLVGEEGADKMWLLVQHCDRDLEFQKICLQLLKEAVAIEDAPKRHLAYLMDRVLVNERLPQLYGTQIQLIDNQAIPRPIENPDQLDERRAEMGLEPWDDYLTALKQVYHIDK